MSSLYRGRRESQFRQAWVLNNSVKLDLGNLAQLLLWVFQLVNSLLEPEADLSAMGRRLLQSSELLTACWPQRRKGTTPRSLLSSTERWSCCSSCLLLLRDTTKALGGMSQLMTCWELWPGTLFAFAQRHTSLLHLKCRWELRGCYGQWLVNRQKLGAQHTAASNPCSNFWALCSSAVPRQGMVSFFCRVSCCKRRMTGTPVTGFHQRKTDAQVSVSISMLA